MLSRYFRDSHRNVQSSRCRAQLCLILPMALPGKAWNLRKALAPSLRSQAPLGRSHHVWGP